MVEEPVWRKKAIALELFHNGGFPRESHQRLVVDRSFPPGLAEKQKRFSSGFLAVLVFKSKQGKTDTLPCFILIAWKWFCTAEVRFGAISSSTITWIFQRLFVWSRLVKVYLCLGQAVVPILALAQVCLCHQLVPLLHVQVFVSHLIKTSSSAALASLGTTEVYDRGSITVQLL